MCGDRAGDGASVRRGSRGGGEPEGSRTELDRTLLGRERERTKIGFSFEAREGVGDDGSAGVARDLPIPRLPLQGLLHNRYTLSLSPSLSMEDTVIEGSTK